MATPPKTIPELRVSHARWFADPTVQWKGARYAAKTFDAGPAGTVFVSSEVTGPGQSTTGPEQSRAYCIRLAQPGGRVVDLSPVFGYWDRKKVMRHAEKVAAFFHHRASVETCQAWITGKLKREWERVSGDQ